MPKRSNVPANYLLQENYDQSGRLGWYPSRIIDIEEGPEDGVNGGNVPEMGNIKSWLSSIGCENHADVFEENGITTELLNDLTEADLKELGLNIGDRIRFRRAVELLFPAEPEAATQVDFDSTTAAAAPPATGEQQASRERRRLTVMFVDLVGSTNLSTQLDPEDWSDALRDYQDTVSGHVTRFGGHVAQYLGDGLLCFFGWPQAMEDAAERAVESALKIIEAVPKYKLLGEPMACRIGIATGLVVVGELIGRNYSTDNTAIGETLNFAARLQGFAQTDQIVISDSTRQLLGNAFQLEDLGKHSLKGIPQKQHIFALISDNHDYDRFAARKGQSYGSLVGRENELALLVDRWKLTREGEGQVITLIGEAGIGKSRITRALFESLSKEEYLFAAFHSSPYHQDTAFWPVTSRMIAATGIQSEDSVEEQLGKVRWLLDEAGIVDQTSIGIVADLLGVNCVGTDVEPKMSPSAKRAATFTTLVDYIVALSKKQPLIMLVEDAHWTDPTTLELINAVVDRLERERIMLMITCRPEKEIGLQSWSYSTSVRLNKLGRRGVEEIVSRMGGDKLSKETIDLIVQRTDGVPLFVEELSKVMVESGDLSVPVSLHDTLMARLDQLPEVKEVAQIASAFGREFEAGPLALVSEQSSETINESLESLVKIELVFSRSGRDGAHIFKHALVRDAAYESLLNRRRQEIHGLIFNVLKEVEDTTPGVLAHHAAEAGMLADAVRYGRIAAEQALSRPAYAEAIAHLDKTIALLDQQESSNEVLEQRKQLLLLSGQARIAHFGYAAESTVKTYAEIEAIAKDSDDAALLVDGLYGRWAGQYVPGRNLIALEIADSICDISGQTNDDLAVALGLRLRGTVLTMMGRIEPAMEALSQVDDHYNHVIHKQYASRFGQDVSIAGKCYRIGVLTLNGRLDAAAELAKKVLTDLDIVNHPHTSGYALGHLACFLCAARISPIGEEIAQKCIEISELEETPLWAALGHASLAVSMVHKQQAKEALPELGSALELLKTLKFSVFRTVLLPVYARALALAGEISTANSKLAEAMELIEENDARYSEVDIICTQGRIKLLQGERTEALVCFERGVAKTQERGHLTAELSAASLLFEMLAEDGQSEKGREILQTAYDKFEEGHSWPILLDAAKQLEL
ncbi:MAG: AAA family ATPase [Rhizobiaceae bacterium]|nr:AAA family ATPase [Rhizobiaceae bacterium]